MRKTSRRILTGFVVVIVGLSGAYAFSLSRSVAKLRAAQAALEADGRPINAAEMIPPEVPDEQNAALFYERAAAALKRQHTPRKTLLEYLSDLSRFAFRDSPDPERRAELERLIKQDLVVRALADIEQGTQRPACRFNRDYRGGLLADLPMSKDARGLVRILAARAGLEAEGGDPHKAWETVQTQLRLADAFRDEPTCDSQLTRVIMTNYSCRIIQELCEDALPDEDGCRKIDSILKGLDGVEPLVRAVDAERLLKGEWLFSLPRDEMYEALSQSPWVGDEGPEILRRLAFRFIVFRPRLLADHAAYLQRMRKGTQLLQGPYVPRGTEGYEEIWNVPGHYLLTHDLSPMLEFMTRFYCKAMTRLRLTRAGLGLLQYRRTHGAYPATLDALGLEGLNDPFTNESLRYRNEGESFLVYGVDEDCKDNGGTEKESREDKEFDILWRFPRQTEDEAANEQ
ncbi:MAG: hypothetical protein JSU70_04400 [Phycisphaerales bacterium]|nr:MAG: hypothetical protein JSU70_04400 [Phycisphaerales bacterium]